MFQFPNKFNLALLPTPIEPLPNLSKEWGVDIRVKRDDLTGSHLSGNKIRKLEFLLADAKHKGCDTVVTCGAVTSNHARATVLAARRLGMDSVLVLAGDKPESAQGNLQLDLLGGAEVRYIPRKLYVTDGERILQETGEELRGKGKIPYVIPTGGSNGVGALGYAKAVEEIKQQCAEANWQPDIIVCAVGSGGTYTGLLLGNLLFEYAQKIMGILVCATEKYFKEKVIQDYAECQSLYQGVPELDESKIHLLDGYIAGGYAKTNEEQLHFLRHAAQTEALILDPVYTNKAFFGLEGEIRAGRIVEGSKVLFVHTGGIFGLSAFSHDMTSLWGSMEHWPDTKN